MPRPPGGWPAGGVSRQVCSACRCVEVARQTLRNRAHAAQAPPCTVDPGPIAEIGIPSPDLALSRGPGTDRLARDRMKGSGDSMQEAGAVHTKPHLRELHIRASRRAWRDESSGRGVALRAPVDLPPSLPHRRPAARFSHGRNDREDCSRRTAWVGVGVTVGSDGGRTRADPSVPDRAGPTGWLPGGESSRYDGTARECGRWRRERHRIPQDVTGP
jgi:hypothetical protein